MRAHIAKRLTALAFLFGSYIFLAAVVNLLIPRAYVSEKAWRYLPTVPAIPPLGADLRIFVDASFKMYTGDNPLQINYNSPPLTAAVFFPFTLMSYELAYKVQFILNLLENFVSLILIFLLLRSALTASASPFKSALTLPYLLGLVFVVACFSQFIGYPFEFSLERGNYDSLVLLVICTAGWFIRRYPSACWFHVLLFSFAAHLKVYPAILLFIPLWQHGWRALLPLITINVLMLFCFGFHRGVEFLLGLYQYSLHPYIWSGNHSAAAFASLVLDPHLGSILPARIAHEVSSALAVALPIGLWLYGTVKLIRQGFSQKNVFLAIGLAIPVMCVLPSVSNDYKLVITILPACLCLLHYARGFVEAGSRGAYLAAALTLLCLLLIDRSVLFSPLLIASNKYPSILLLEILTCIVVIQEVKSSSQLFSSLPNPIHPADKNPDG